MDIASEGDPPVGLETLEYVHTLKTTVRRMRASAFVDTSLRVLRSSARVAARAQMVLIVAEASKIAQLPEDDEPTRRSYRRFQRRQQRRRPRSRVGLRCVAQAQLEHAYGLGLDDE